MSNHLVDLNCFPKKWYNHFWLVTFSFERKFRFTFETCLFLLEIPAVLLSVTQPMIKSQTMTEYLYQNRRDCQICTMIVEIFCFEKVQIFGSLKEDWVRNDGLALSADPEKQERKIFHASFWEAFCLRSDMWQDDYFCKDFASYFSVFALFSSIDYELCMILERSRSEICTYKDLSHFSACFLKLRKAFDWVLKINEKACRMV